jgi:type II secretory pathway pseudopilin PulG
MPEIAAILPQAPGGVDNFLSIYGQRMAARAKEKNNALSAAQQQQEQERKQQEQGFNFLNKMANDAAPLPDDVRLQQVRNQKVFELVNAGSVDLQKNPNMSTADLYAKYFPKANEIAQYSNSEKQFKESKASILSQYDKIPGFNMKEAEMLLNKAYFGNGDVKNLVTDPDKLNQALQRNLHKVITTNEGVQDYAMKRGIHQVTTSKKESWKIPDYMEMYGDTPDVKHTTIKLDIPTQQITGRPASQPEVKTHSYLQDVLPKDKTGAVKLLSEDEFANLMQDDRTRFVLEARTRALQDDYEQQTGKPMEMGPVSQNLMMRSLGYKILSEYSRDAVKEAPAVSVNTGGSNSGRTPRQKTETEVKADNYTGTVQKIYLQEEGTIDGSGTPTKINVNGADQDAVNISHLFNGGAFRMGKDKYGEIIVVPGKKNTVYLQDDSGNVTEYSGTAAINFFKKYSEANGGDWKKFDKVTADLNKQASTEDAKKQYEADKQNINAVPSFLQNTNRVIQGISDFFKRK